jgi:GNAT superfamily N-acetyltransferase
MKFHAVPQIRLFSPSDSIAELTELLHRAYAPLGDSGLNYTAVNQTAEVTAKRIQGGACYLATLANTLVGTIVVRPSHTNSECEFYNRPEVATANQLAVDPEYQGMGVGRLLLAKAELWASDNGFHELAIDTAEQAIHLVGFYTALGYRPITSIQWSGKHYKSVILSKCLSAMI